MNYVVFEDLQNKKSISSPEDFPVKIHKEDCHHYVKRKIDAVTVKWHGPFETLNLAEKYAENIGKTWKKAQCIKTT